MFRICAFLFLFLLSNSTSGQDDFNVTKVGNALFSPIAKDLEIRGDYAKPDVHIIELFKELGLSTTGNPYQVFKEVLLYAQDIGQIPYRVDKVFWLIGSAKLYLDWEGDQAIRNYINCKHAENKTFLINRSKRELRLEI